jgi:hypothetical protein
MKDVSRAVAYTLFIPDLTEAGREVGYAIAVHGSMARDLDLIAVPWTDEAVSAERLIMHLLAAVDGKLVNGSRRKEVVGKPEPEWERVPASEPTVKPHGRLAWTIHVGYQGMYIDVSVTPRLEKAIP